MRSLYCDWRDYSGGGKLNRISDEMVYNLTLNCNDMVFHVGIAQKNLLGEPIIGRRFKGQIWMQGVAVFEE